MTFCHHTVLTTGLSIVLVRFLSLPLSGSVEVVAVEGRDYDSFINLKLASARFTCLLDFRDGYYARSGLLDYLNSNSFDYRLLIVWPTGFGRLVVL